MEDHDEQRSALAVMERTLRVLKRAGIIIGDTIYLTLYAIFWLAAVASFAVVWLALRGLI